MRAWIAVALLAVLAGAPASAQGRDAVLEVFRTQAEMERRLLAIDLAGLERAQEQLSSAADRLVRLGNDLVRAEREGEESGSFAARTADLRRAEAEVTELIVTCQQLRGSLGARRAHLEQLEVEIRRLQESTAARPDDLSGRWSVAVEPGAQRGVFDLRLDGTIVQGTYQLGTWKGSLRGTFINGNVRLERIDAELGFVAVLTGRLVTTREGERRLEGAWEGTNLAAGMATSGSWVARRQTAAP